MPAGVSAASGCRKLGFASVCERDLEIPVICTRTLSEKGRRRPLFFRGHNNKGGIHMNKNSKTIAVLLAVAVSAALPLAAHAQSTTSIGIYAGVSAGQAEALAYDCSAVPTFKM